jgi:hypothetical protein
MNWLIGISLLVLGALPLLAGWIMWMGHMYTVGLSLNAERALEVLFMADVVCLTVGLYLITSKGAIPKIKRDE